MEREHGKVLGGTTDPERANSLAEQRDGLALSFFLPGSTRRPIHLERFLCGQRDGRFYKERCDKRDDLFQRHGIRLKSTLA